MRCLRVFVLLFFNIIIFRMYDSFYNLSCSPAAVRLAPSFSNAQAAANCVWAAATLGIEKRFSILPPFFILLSAIFYSLVGHMVCLGLQSLSYSFSLIFTNSAVIEPLFAAAAKLSPYFNAQEAANSAWAAATLSLTDKSILDCLFTVGFPVVTNSQLCAMTNHS